MAWSVTQNAKNAFSDKKSSLRSSLAESKENTKTTIDKKSITDSFLELANLTYKSAVDKVASTAIIKCKVVGLPASGESNRYKVEFQENSNLNAITSSKDVKYAIGSIVSAIVPNGNFDEDLIIIGAYSEVTEDTLTKSDYYEQVGPNVLDPSLVFHLKSWEPTPDTYPVIGELPDNIITITEESRAALIYDLLSRENGMACYGITVKTDIDENYQGQGNYGLRIRVPIKKTTSQVNNPDLPAVEWDYEEIVLFDTTTMLGNPYKYIIDTNQKFYTNVGEQVEYATTNEELEEHPILISAFVDDNWTYPDNYIPTKEYDIEFKNLQFFEVAPVPEEYQNGYYFILTAPKEGTLFTMNSGSTTLVPSLRYKMKNVDIEGKYLCYWFRKNSSITRDSEIGYLPLGGVGWECLNEIQSTMDDGTRKYISDEYTYTVLAQDVGLRSIYKCVLVPIDLAEDENTIIENLESGYLQAQITLKKLNTGITVNLESDLDDLAYNSTAVVTLIATLKDSLGKYRDKVIDLNFSRYNSNGDLIGDSNFCTRIKVETEGDTYKYYYRFPANIIPPNSYNTITCAFSTLIQDSQQDIGEASLVVKVGANNKYNLTTTGTAFYKYDQYGNAPTLDTYAGSGKRILQIVPLSFELANSNGKIFELNEYIGWTFTWSIPKNSLIEVDLDELRHKSANYEISEDDDYYYISSSQYSLNEINYTIANKFNKTKAERNTVKLDLINDNNIDRISENIVITFTKDGLVGTNGSNYSAIVLASIENPDIKEEAPNLSIPIGTWGPSEYEEEIVCIDNESRISKLQAFYYNGTWHFTFPCWISQFEKYQIGTPNVQTWLNYTTYNQARPRFSVKVMKEGREIGLVQDDESTTNGYSVAWSMLTDNDSNYYNRKSKVSFQIDSEGYLSPKNDASWTTGDTFFNIVQAKIKVANAGNLNNDSENCNYEYLYAYYPIEVTFINLESLVPTPATANYYPQLEGGFSEVIYRSDGLLPSYVNNTTFTIKDSNVNSRTANLFNYNWTVSNNLYITDEEDLPKEYNNNEGESEESSPWGSQIIKPTSNFDNNVTANYVKISYEKNLEKEQSIEQRIHDIRSEIPRLEKNYAYLTQRKQILSEVSTAIRVFYQNLNISENKYNYRYNNLLLLIKNENAGSNYFSIVNILGYIVQLYLRLTRIGSEHSSYPLLQSCATDANNHYNGLLNLSTNPLALNSLENLKLLNMEEDFDPGEFYSDRDFTDFSKVIAKYNQLAQSYNNNFTNFTTSGNFDLSCYSVIYNQIKNLKDYRLYTNQNVEINNPEVSGETLTFSINLSTDDNYLEGGPDFYINKDYLLRLAGFIDNYSSLHFNATKSLLTKTIISPIRQMAKTAVEEANRYDSEMTKLWDNIIALIEEKDLLITEKNYLIQIDDGHKVIHIKPILFITETAEFNLLHGWDGTSAYTIQDDKIGECLYQPQIGAGEWDAETNSFRGLVIGVKKYINGYRNKENYMRGMFGYGPNVQGGSGSQQSLLLNSDTGQLILGSNSSSRLIFDPSNSIEMPDGQKRSCALIFSGDFYKGKNIEDEDGTYMPSSYDHKNETGLGMIINLTKPEIRFGNGNYELDNYGNMYAAGVGRIAGWTLKDTEFTSVPLNATGQDKNHGLHLRSGYKVRYLKDEGGAEVVTYDVEEAKLDAYGQPVVDLDKDRRKRYDVDEENTPAIYSNKHDSLQSSEIGFYASEDGISTFNNYYQRVMDSSGSGEYKEITIDEVTYPVYLYKGTVTIEDEYGHTITFTNPEVIEYYDEGFYEVNQDEATEDWQMYFGKEHSSLDGFTPSAEPQDTDDSGYQFRIIQNGELTNYSLPDTLNPTVKKSRIILSTTQDTPPSIQIGEHDSLTSTKEGVYLGENGFSLGDKAKLMSTGVLYLGKNATALGGTEQVGSTSGYWTIDGVSESGTNRSYIAYKTTTLGPDNGSGGYKRDSVYIGTDGIRVGASFKVDNSSRKLYLGNLNSTDHCWEMDGTSVNNYLAYGCAGIYNDSEDVCTDLSPCIYKYEGDQEGFPANGYRIEKTEGETVISVGPDSDDLNGGNSDYHLEPDDDDKDQESGQQYVVNNGPATSEDKSMQEQEVTAYKVEIGQHANSIYLGKNGLRIGSRFAISKDGIAVLKAGTIGGWSFDGNKMVTTLSSTIGQAYYPNATIHTEGNLKQASVNTYGFMYKIYQPDTEIPQDTMTIPINDTRFVEENRNKTYRYSGSSAKVTVVKVEEIEYNEVETPAASPATSGWYERDNPDPNMGYYTYTLSTDLSPVSGKTYYEKGKTETHYRYKVSGYDPSDIKPIYYTILDSTKGLFGYKVVPKTTGSAKWETKKMWYIKSNGNAYFKKYATKDWVNDLIGKVLTTPT